MKMRVQTGFISIVALAMMGLAGCDHYVCSSGANFGGTACTSSGSGLGTQGSGGSATAAFVFVADAAGTGSAGTIDGYTLNTTASTFGATPSYVAPTTPLNDSGVGMVVAQEKYLYTGYGSTLQIFGWTIGTDGSLTAVSGSPYSAPFMDFVATGFGTQKLATNPAGTLLFFSAFGSPHDDIYVYQIGAGGALTAVSGSPFSAPFVGNLATDGLGNYLYLTQALDDHTGSAVAAFAIATTGASAGALTPVVGSPFTGVDYKMWQVQGEPTGKFLIGTSGNSAATGFSGTDDDHLYVFSIAQSGADAGAITPVSGSPFATQSSPLSIAVQPNASGNLVYSFGLADNDLAFNPVEGYTISSTGTLTAASGSPFTAAALGDLGAFDQSGAFLFTYGGVIDSSTQVVSYQMGAFSVASGGALTEPTSTLSLTSGGFFAVTDPQ